MGNSASATPAPSSSAPPPQGGPTSDAELCAAVARVLGDPVALEQECDRAFYDGQDPNNPQERISVHRLHVVTQGYIARLECRHPSTLRRIQSIFELFSGRPEGVTIIEFRGYMASLFTQIHQELASRSGYEPPVELPPEPEADRGSAQTGSSSKSVAPPPLMPNATTNHESIPPPPPPRPSHPRLHEQVSPPQRKFDGPHNHWQAAEVPDSQTAPACSKGGLHLPKQLQGRIQDPQEGSRPAPHLPKQLSHVPKQLRGTEEGKASIPQTSGQPVMEANTPPVPSEVKPWHMHKQLQEQRELSLQQQKQQQQQQRRQQEQEQQLWQQLQQQEQQHQQQPWQWQQQHSDDKQQSKTVRAAPLTKAAVPKAPGVRDPEELLRQWHQPNADIPEESVVPGHMELDEAPTYELPKSVKMHGPGTQTLHGPPVTPSPDPLQPPTAKPESGYDDAVESTGGAHAAVVRPLDPGFWQKKITGAKALASSGWEMFASTMDSVFVPPKEAPEDGEEEPDEMGDERAGVPDNVCGHPGPQGFPSAAQGRPPRSHGTVQEILAAQGLPPGAPGVPNGGVLVAEGPPHNAQVANVRAAQEALEHTTEAVPSGPPRGQGPQDGIMPGIHYDPTQVPQGPYPCPPQSQGKSASSYESPIGSSMGPGSEAAHSGSLKNGMGYQGQMAGGFPTPSAPSRSVHFEEPDARGPPGTSWQGVQTIGSGSDMRGAPGAHMANGNTHLPESPEPANGAASWGNPAAWVQSQVQNISQHPWGSQLWGTHYPEKQYSFPPAGAMQAANGGEGSMFRMPKPQEVADLLEMEGLVAHVADEDGFMPRRICVDPERTHLYMLEPDSAVPSVFLGIPGFGLEGLQQVVVTETKRGDPMLSLEFKAGFLMLGLEEPLAVGGLLTVLTDGRDIPVVNQTS